MKRSSIAGLAISLMVATAFISPAAAGSLLGILGSSDSGSLVTIGSGSAGGSGLVNVGLGGGDGHVVSANVGPSGSSGGGGLVNATVNAGGGSGLGVNVGALNDNVRANVGVGGGNGLSVNVGVGGNRGGGGGPGVGGPGGPGGPGVANNGGNRNPGGFGGGGGSAGHIGFASDPSCNGVDPNAALRLFDRTSFSGWNRASGIQIVPIKVCPTAKRQLSGVIASQQKHVQMQRAVMSDALVAAALSRSSIQPNRVLGVERNGSQLTVFVY